MPICNRCHGMGCRDCAGEGYVQGDICPLCHGAGCPDCGGTGDAEGRDGNA